MRGEPRARGEGKRTVALRRAILRVLEEIPVKMSSRQIAYQCATYGDIANTEKEKKRVGRLVVKMRRDGSIPYSRIVDRSRAKHHRQGWDDIREALTVWRKFYRRDPWRDQDTIPMVACEKQALEGVFSEIVDRYGASLWVIRGFNSESFDFEWAEEIRDLTHAGKRVVVYYFGDWDPSGVCIEETSRRKLAEFGADFEWVRAGLLPADFERFGIMRIPVKRTDTRAKAFLSKFGDQAAELDALKPDELERRIRACLEAHIDRDRWDGSKRAEQAELESLNVVAGNWKAAVEAARDAA